MPLPKHLSRNQVMRAMMDEWKKGRLHSGKGGKVVKSYKQAVAIALSKAGKARR